MATSQQGKKKKKVLSQQQIDKLLGMLREEDKPLRAGILAKTLGYQSAKDINPTLLRLEGYGMVSRVTMNNTPLWKYVSREGIAAMTSTSPRVEDDLVKEEEEIDMARVHILAGPRLAHETCTINQVIDVREDSCPSRPQSTKADLEWDPSDIQAHREEEGGLHMGDADVADYHVMTAYSNNGTSSFTSPNLAISLSHATKGPMSTTLVHLADTATGLDGVNGAGDATVLCFSANQGYAAAQDIYSAIDAQQEQLTVHTPAMNGLSGGKMAATTNGQSFVGQDYVDMSAYNGTGDAHLNGRTDLNSAMQNNYNVEYGHQRSPHSESGSRGGVNGSDMFMPNGSVQHHVSNGGNSSIQTNHQNFLLNSVNQVHSDYAHSNNNYRSSMPPSTPPHKSTATSNMQQQQQQQQQQSYSGGDNHHHNHNSYNSYNTSSSSLGRMPTYVVQEMMKPEAVGQYGMTAPQGAPDARQVGGYQSVHTHPHPQGLDAGAMPPYSGQPFHTTTGLNNGGPSTQHHHPHHQPHLPHSQQHQQTQHQQQQPLTQSANFVNVGNFPGATYNQFQGTYGLSTQGRPYSGQHQSTGYSTASLGPSKDLANYSGNNGAAAYHGSQLNKRQHFNGYTGAGMFTNHVRPPIYPSGKMGGHVRSTTFQKQSGFSRTHHTDRQRGGHPHGRARFGLQGRGGPRTAAALDQCEDGKVKHASIYTTDKESAKMEANKYMGTEVLDDICRRLANQASVQKKNASLNQQVEETAKDAEKTVQKDHDGKEKEKDKNSKKSKSDSVNDTGKILSNSKKDRDSSKNPCNTDDEKVLTNGKEHSSNMRTQNSNRGYGAKQYAVRGGYHGRDASRYHQHHRNSSRNGNGRTKGPTESVANGKLLSQNEPYENVSESAANGKAGESKEQKDTTKGSEDIKAVEVNCSTSETSSEQVQDDRPMAKYRALLLDHLDPNNVLLSHLFVRGLIDRVLVDQVRRMKTRRDAMEVLLPALLTIPQDAVNTGFCDALQKSGQVYLAELIKAAGLAGQCMSEQHAAYLKLHQQNIAASMIPDKDLLTYLRTDSVLTHDLHRFVSTQPSRAQQIDTLLQVLPFRGDKAFETFRTALRRSGQPWLAEQIAMELT